MLIRTIAVVLAAMLIAARVFAAEEKIRITYANNSLTFLAAFIAKDRGFYARNGLTAELIQARPAVNIAALLSGDVDYVEVFGSAIRSAARGAPIRAFSNSIKAPFFSLVVQPSIKSVKDLKGRVVGVASVGGTNQISGRLLFQHFGLDPDKEIKFLGIGGGEFGRRGFKSKPRRPDPRRAAVLGHDETGRLSRARERRRHRRVSARRAVDDRRPDQAESFAGEARAQIRDRSAPLSPRGRRRVDRRHSPALRDGRSAGARLLRRRRQRLQPRCQNTGRFRR